MKILKGGLFLHGLILSSLFFFHSFTPQARAQEDGRQGEAQARQRRGGARRAQRHAREGGKLLAQLNLSPEQLTQMREIRAQSEPEARALARRLNLARRALDGAIYSDGLNEASIEVHAREVADAQAAIVRLRARTELKVRNVLTPEQLQSFRELRRQARDGQRMERRFGRGDARRRRGFFPNDNSNRNADDAFESRRDSAPFSSTRERRRGAPLSPQ